MLSAALTAKNRDSLIDPFLLCLYEVRYSSLSESDAEPHVLTPILSELNAESDAEARVHLLTQPRTSMIPMGWCAFCLDGSFTSDDLTELIRKGVFTVLRVLQSRDYSVGAIMLVLISILFLGVSYAELAAALTFDPPQNLSANPGILWNPQVAVSGSNVFVAWEDSLGADILFRRSADGGSTWNPPLAQPAAQLSNTATRVQFDTIRVAAAGDNVFVTWVEQTDSFHL